jgi:hypothetical protein
VETARATGVEVGSTGAGFFVDRTGFIVTNAHVVEGCVRVHARNSANDAPLGARLVVLDKVNDLALLRVGTAALQGRSGGGLSQSLNVAMHTTRVGSFLEGQHVEFETAPAGRTLGVADVAERARRLPVIVECVK